MAVDSPTAILECMVSFCLSKLRGNCAGNAAHARSKARVSPLRMEQVVCSHRRAQLFSERIEARCHDNYQLLCFNRIATHAPTGKDWHKVNYVSSAVPPV